MLFSLPALVTANPEDDITAGEQLIIESKRFPIESTRSAGQVENWGVFEGAVLAVAFPDESWKANVLGSAVLVAPGIAIGAMHVFEHAALNVMNGQVGAFCFGMDGRSPDIWRIQKVTSSASGKSDLAVFSLVRASALPSDRTLTQAWISTRTPAVGELLTLVGFTAGAPKEPISPHVSVGVSLIFSKGVVTQQFPQQRDTFGLPAPCVEVECETIGGMSGGPVFDAAGNVIGILSKGLDGGPCWVSLLWPALGWKIQGGWPVGLMKESRRLLDIDPRICRIEGREAMTLHHAGSKVTYASWS
jgi:hypothetical protein